MRQITDEPPFLLGFQEGVLETKREAMRLLTELVSDGLKGMELLAEFSTRLVAKSQIIPKPPE